MLVNGDLLKSDTRIFIDRLKSIYKSAKNNIKTFFRKIKLTGIILVILEWRKQLFRNFNDILLQNHLEVICINWCFIILQPNSRKKRMHSF